MKDKQIEKLIKAEKARQKKVINLIASENYVSEDVLKALGSEFTNKYAEGYPGKRYYGGNENSDKLEELAKERALELFNLSPNEWSVNVQPLSGSPANVAVYLALVPPGGKIMGMDLASGGHLTHGHKVSISGKMWTQVPYGVDKESGLINYEEVKQKAIAEKPAIIVAGFTAYSRVIDFKKFREIADSCGAIDFPQYSAENGKGVGETGVFPWGKAVSEASVENREVLKSKLRSTILMVDMSHFAGLVAGGVYPSPFEYADIVTTTTHKTLRGPRSAIIFSRKDPPNMIGRAGTRELDKKIDKAVFPGMQGGPHLNQIAAVAVALKEAKSPAFKKYAAQVIKNAKVLAEELAKLGWKIISGGTDSHLVLIDVWNGGNPSTSSGRPLTGREASEKLESAGIIVNKNTIPFDSRSPMDPSGIRIGTAAETTRGKKEKNFKKIAVQIDKILKGTSN